MILQHQYQTIRKGGSIIIKTMSTEISQELYATRYCQLNRIHYYIHMHKTM